MHAPRWLAFALIACACAGAPSAPPRVAPPSVAPAASPGDFFPLAIGNSWTFLDRSAQQQEVSHHTVRIMKKDADGYFVDDQKNALRADGECLHDRSRRLLCKPIQPGTSWTSVVSPSVTERYRIAATGEKVTVPAGTFTDCVRVRSQARVEGVEQVAELTYAPGVGLIRIETFSIVDGAAAPQIRGELESYRLVNQGK